MTCSFGGVFAAVLSSAIVALGYRVAVGATNGDLFAIPFDGAFTAVLIAALFGGGAIVGAIGSYLGVRRFLAA